MGLAQIQHLLDTTVTIAPWTGQDRYGQPLLGSPVSVKAKVEQGLYRARGTNGEALVARYLVILNPLSVDPRDVITLPSAFGVRDGTGAFGEVTPPILQVRPVFLKGQHDHTVLYLG